MAIYKTTVQFPSEEAYKQLKVLAAVREEPVGEVIGKLVDAELLKTKQKRTA